MNIGILGIGEVGSAIKKIVEEKHKVFIADKKEDRITGNKIDILHICIPYSSLFIKTVIQAIDKYQPKLTIIESTTSPGTTDLIFQKTKRLICHSPIRGIHPNLIQGIKTFVKYIGPTSKKAGIIAQKYYQNLGIKTQLFKNAKTTEIAKLMDTTYYGWNIVFQKEMHQICQKNKTLFREAYTQWNETYNQGYKKLGMNYVIRPVLKHAPGKIGGHCIIPNCEILKQLLPNPISSLIVKLNKTY